MIGDILTAALIQRGHTLAAAETLVGEGIVLRRPSGALVGIEGPLPTESEAATILAPYTKAERLADVRAQATALIQANLPQPWDVLRHLASPEFQAWADDYLGLVAAELARLETAIETDQEAIRDWPEVEP
jgi:hypothetical protein